MFLSFYDKDFNALQNNATLVVGTYNLTRRAVDFDDFTAISQPFTEDVNPTFVVMKDDIGNYKYGAFAGVPALNKDNQTELQASDLKTFFNNEMLVGFGTYTKLNDYFTFVFNKFNSDVVQGSFNIELKAYNVWEELILPYLKYYDLFIESKLNIAQKKIIFSVKKSNKFILPLKLWEINAKNYEKWVVSVNEAQGAVAIDNVITNGTKFILLSDNSITSNVSLRDLFPIKRKAILKETDDTNKLVELLNEANIEALTTLIQNRYNESLEFNTANEERYNNATFETAFDVYASRGEFYKRLPLGEIRENNNNTKTLVAGYRNSDIVNFI